jgi:hypothetical protein
MHGTTTPASSQHTRHQQACSSLHVLVDLIFELRTRSICDMYAVPTVNLMCAFCWLVLHMFGLLIYDAESDDESSTVLSGGSLATEHC